MQAQPVSLQPCMLCWHIIAALPLLAWQDILSCRIYEEHRVTVVWLRRDVPFLLLKQGWFITASGNSLCAELGLDRF